MRCIREKKLDVVIQQLTQPVLGICLGQQLMCKNIEEGNATGLGIFDVNVKRFPAKDVVPHMGWNTLIDRKGPLMTSVSEGDDVYFVHSYYCELAKETTAICDYILPFSAALQHNNFFATQFHPEKSGKTGALILENFLRI